MPYTVEKVTEHLDFLKEVFDELYQEFPSDVEVHWLGRDPEGELVFHVFVKELKDGAHAKARPDDAEALTNPRAFALTVRERVMEAIAAIEQSSLPEG